MLEQHSLQGETEFDELMEKARENGWEGLILRKNVPYQGKRSKNMLKCKDFHDAEYVVEGVLTGPIRFIKDQTEHEENMLTKVTITHKDNKVGVGSGWSLEQRRHYYKHPEEIIGKTITVQYFEESADEKTGLPSLRFPTVKWVHGDQRDT